MSINIYFSNQIEELAEKLASTLAEDKKSSNPFYSPMILVPNINVQKWLQMFIASRNGIAINNRFFFLESGFTNIIRQLGEMEGLALEDYAFLGHRENHLDLQLIILSVINNISDDNALAPIYDYINVTSPRDRARRSWQLADRLTLYFREYEYQRKEMLDCWRNNRLFCDNKNYEAIESCQRALYRKIFFEPTFLNNIKKKTKKKYITLPQYASYVLNRLSTELVFEKEHIYIFGFSHISRFHYRLILEFEKFYNIELFQLNMLEEFSKPGRGGESEGWKKLKSSEIINIRGELAINKEENPLIRAWAKPSRENLRLLGHLIDEKGNIDSKSYWLSPVREKRESLSMLELVKNSILHETLYESEMQRTKQDRSLQIAGAPSLRREVETVYNSIIYNLNENNDLKLTDIAVLVPDMRKYKGVILSVFSKNPSKGYYPDTKIDYSTYIPYNLTDSTADIDSIFGNALLTGLKVAEGVFNRQEIFDFVLNPCFLTATGVSREEAAGWIEWVDRLSIYHSYGQKDKTEESASGSSLYTWSEGLRRLKLGRIMEPEEQEELMERESVTFLPFVDLNSADGEKLNSFIYALEYLLSFLLSIKGKEFSGKVWSQKLNYFISEFLSIPEEMAGENYVLNKMVESINKLSLFDDLYNRPGKKIGLTYIVEFIKSHLVNITSKVGRYLTDGITISSLVPMRPIPFKVVYILGLNQDEFPGSQDNSTLDLRNARRILGDISLPEANNYLFLELIAAVKEKLYLSYISKNLQKDEELYPSQVVNRLVNYINDELLPEGESFQTVELPLKSDSIRFYEESPDYQDLLYNYFNSGRLMSYLYLEKRGLYSFTPQELEQIESYYNQSQAVLSQEIKGSFEKNIHTISLNDLYNFLVNPVEAQIKRHLDLYEESDEDRLALEDEPFYTSYPLDYRIIIDSYNKYIESRCNNPALKNGVEVTEQYVDRLYNYYQMEGKTPESIFASFDREKLKRGIIDFIESDSTGFKSLIDELVDKEFHNRVTITGATSEGKESFKPPIIKPQGVDREINITGELSNIFVNEEENSIETVVLTNSSKPDSPISRHVIRPLLFYLIMQAGEESSRFIGTKELKIHVLHKEKIRSYSPFSIEPDEARQYLQELVTAFMDTKNFDMLPFDIIIKPNNNLLPDEGNRADYNSRLSNKIEDSMEESFSSYHHLKLLEIIRPVIPEDAFEKIKKRYRFLLSLNKES